MFLLYLDDSGSVENPKETHFVLGGFAVHEVDVMRVNDVLDQMATDRGSPTVEFHASEIFSRRTPPWNALGREDAQRVIKQVLSVACRDDLRIAAFAVAINKHDCLAAKADPMLVAFTGVVHAFAHYLNRDDVNGKGLIILDESTHATKLERYARTFRQQIKPAIPFPADRIVEGPLFVSSRSFRCIQLADHIAYAVFRRYEAKDANYFDVFAHRFASEAGVISGLRHYDLSLEKTCVCPACVSIRLKSLLSKHQQDPVSTGEHE